MPTIQEAFSILREVRAPQLHMAELVAAAIATRTHLIVEAGTGTGKALDVETPIPTPSGWTRMGDLRVGDQVFDEHGRRCNVIGAWDVQHDRPCFGLTFSDGSKVVADADHQWVTTTRKERVKESRKGPSFAATPATVTTREIAGAIRTPTGHANHAIPVAGSLDTPSVDLPLEPYFLGAWLGDGSATSAHITKPDEELFEQITACGYQVRRVPSSAMTRHVALPSGAPASRYEDSIPRRLRASGVWGDKHIPTAYLRASREQRLALLQGLMDTDGTAGHSGLTYDSTSERLARGVLELVTSLGYQPTLRRKVVPAARTGECFSVGFSTTDAVFRLPRKRAAQLERIHGQKGNRDRLRYIVAAEPVESRPVRCITVDSPSHLFLAGTAMIPTHNSFGYLIPAVSQEKKIVVATYTIALQEQLMRYDIPFLQKAMRENFGIEFKAAMLKGAANYLCRRRFAEAAGDPMPGELAFERGANSLPGDVEDWGRETKTGDMNEAPAMPNELQAAIRIDLDDCGKKACPFFENCHHQRARRDAKAADVLIINQAGLATAMKSPYYLDLSAYDAIIVDEAHQWEDVAREAFGAELKPATIKRLFAAVEKDVLAGKDKHPDWPAWVAARDEFRAAWVETIAYWAALNDEQGRPALWEQKWVALNGDAVARSRAAVTDLGSFLDPRLSDSEPHKKIARQLDSIRSIFTGLSEQGVITVARRDIQKGATSAQVTIETKPLFVGPRLQESLYNERQVRCEACDGQGRAEIGAHDCMECTGLGRVTVPGMAVIYTSATISTGAGDFTHAKTALGLAADTAQAEIGSPFDYDRQALLYIPRGIEPPAYNASREVREQAQQYVYAEIEELLNRSRGRAFVLFTASKAMKDAFYMRQHRWPSRWQEPGANKNDLIAWFKVTPNAVLYATASFWEGVSIEGEQLSMVIIDKVPNTPPEDPVYQAKAAHYGYSQGESFGKLGVPAAIVRLKQGFGRLIRTQQDRGVVAILDGRIHSKGYGRRIIAALPPARLVDTAADRDLFASYLDPAPAEAAPPALSPKQAPDAEPEAVAAVMAAILSGEPMPDGCKGCRWPDAYFHDDSCPGQVAQRNDPEFIAMKADEARFDAAQAAKTVDLIVIQDDQHLAQILDAAAEGPAAVAALAAGPAITFAPDAELDARIAAWLETF